MRAIRETHTTLEASAQRATGTILAEWQDRTHSYGASAHDDHGIEGPRWSPSGSVLGSSSCMPHWSPGRVRHTAVYKDRQGLEVKIIDVLTRRDIATVRGAVCDASARHTTVILLGVMHFAPESALVTSTNSGGPTTSSGRGQADARRWNAVLDQLTE